MSFRRIPFLSELIAVLSMHDRSALRFVDVNDAVLSFGVDREMALGMTLYDFVEEQDRTTVRDAMDALMVRRRSLRWMLWVCAT